MKRRNLISDINVVPYIDVMLVLLVIFMISAPLMVQGIQINLPEASSEALLLTSQEGEHEPIGAEYIFQVGYLDYKRLIAEKIDSDTIMSSVQRNMQAALTKEQSLLEKHLPFLATIASVSPYIGLFGTVWGIMNSFRGLAGSSQATLSAVAPGISEALIATAIGLFAAIPALIAYNKYISDSDRLISSFEGFKEEFSSVLHRDMQSDKK